MSCSETSIQAFEQAGLALMQGLAEQLRVKKEIELREKALKAELQALMEEHGVKSVDNEFLKITYVEGSESTTIDLAAMEKAEPALFADLLRDYPKTTVRKPSVRFTVR